MTVRKATIEDCEPVASYLLLAMEDIVYQFMGTIDTAKAKEFMLHFVQSEANQYSYQNCWIAEDDGEVVAAVNVYDGANLVALRQPVIDYIRLRFNSAFDPEDETQAGEYYIDSLGVKPGRQGKGIGSSLLSFLIEEYVGSQRQALGLLVNRENPYARRLYLKLGFKSVSQKTIFGKQLEHLQLNPGQSVW